MTDEYENPHTRDERYVWFGLAGDFEPDDVSRATGLFPDKSFRKGTSPRPGAAIRKSSAWIIDSRLTPSDEFHEHLEDLLARLRPAWAELCALGRTYNAFVTAAIYCRWSQGPLVVVSPTHSAAIAELGAELGFDIYSLPEEQSGDASGMRLLTRDELGRLNDVLAPEP